MNKAQNFWDRQATRYDETEKQFDPVYRGIIAMTRAYLKPDDRILDYGCATGTKTMELADGIRHIHGLDISAAMINLAIRKKNEVNAKNVSFSQGEIFTSDLEEASFDKIIAFGIIHLLEDSEHVIQRIYELLKPGGLFISATACFRERMTAKNRLGFTVSLFMKRLGIFPLYLNMFNTSDIERLINSHNFNIVKAEKIFDGMTISFIVAEKQ